MATHSSILTWEIPWTEEFGGPQYMGLQRVGHDLVTEQQQHSHSLSLCHCWGQHWISLHSFFRDMRRNDM